jgi:hypothetical protein
VIISIRALFPFTRHLPILFSIWITLRSVCSHFPVALSFIVLLNTSALWVKPPSSFFYYRCIVKSRLRKERSFTHGKQFFTSLDLASGYYQIELDDNAKEKTAFVVENNLYHFTRMPFGVCNGPPTFQRLMNYVLRDRLGTKALVYLDDVLIFSDTLEDHEKDNREVFE